MDKKTAMENLARALQEKDAFNGAWLYAEKGEIVSKGALGFRDPEDTLPITEDTIFQLASVSKTFTAAAVMLLVRQDLLRPEDEITKFFPEIPYPGVTVRHLLNHTSGIPDYFDDADWFISIWKEEKRVPGTEEILRFLRETEAKPYFAPGEGLHYSNTGFNLLALLVERLSGVPYEEFLQKNIFEPAGMTSTRCCHIRRDGIPFENHARATVFEDGRWVADTDSEEDGDVVAFDGLNGDDYVFTNIFDMLRWPCGRAVCSRRRSSSSCIPPRSSTAARTPFTMRRTGWATASAGASGTMKRSGWSSATAAACRASPPGSSASSTRTGLL